MEQEIPKLILSDAVLSTVCATAAETPEGLETGVTLFGGRQDGCRVALFAVGPGPKAIHTPCFHQPDTDHLNREFEHLVQSFPLLEWIGSLHVHPLGMPWLSGHDRGTVGQLLSEQSLHLSDFVAGILQRRGSRFAIYPYLLAPSDPVLWFMPVEIVAEEAEVWRTAQARAKGVHGASSHASHLCLGAELAEDTGNTEVMGATIGRGRRFLEVGRRLARKLRQCVARKRNCNGVCQTKQSAEPTNSLMKEAV